MTANNAIGSLFRISILHAAGMLYLVGAISIIALPCLVSTSN